MENSYRGLLLSLVVASPFVASAPASAVEVEGLDVQSSRVFYDRKGRSFFVEATVTNDAVESLAGPIRILVESANLPVINPDGVADGVPFFVAADTGESLGRGESSAPVRIKFRLARIRPEFTLAADAVPDFTVQILHSSDNESSFQDPNTLETKLLNYSSLVEGLQLLAADLQIPSLHITAGDHTIPGPFYEASKEAFGADGLGDIRVYNAMDLVVNGMGNHEFDGGINDFSRMLAEADYPFIAANLDFSNVSLQARPDPDDDPNPPVPIEIGVDGTNVADNAGKVLKSAFVEIGGERIGVIGRAPADFFNVIENPPVTIPGLDFVGGRDPLSNLPLVSAIPQVLEQVDLLEAQGIDKIILIDHAQDFTADPLSASSLRGIDIIVAAGSTGFMAQDTPVGPFNLLRPTDSPGAGYPTVREDSEGHTVLVINSDQQYFYVGNLIAFFDADGHIIPSQRPENGPVATTAGSVDLLADFIDAGSLAPNPQVQAVFDTLTATDVIQTQFEVVGTTTGVLNGDRSDVRSRETNLGRLAADSTLWFAETAFDGPSGDLSADVALKNGGGIRDTILGPSITRLTVSAALAFDNRISLVELTAGELIAAMENSVSRVPARDGRFPQIAGMRIEYDPTRPGVENERVVTEPSRIKTLVVTSGGAEDVLVQEFEAQGDLDRRFNMATNSFLLTGGDGYRAFREAADERGSQTSNEGEREVLIQYVQNVLGGTVDIVDPPAPPRVSRFSEVRFATFNASLNRGEEGQLIADLSTPDNAQAQIIAEIIQRVNPDVLTLQEFDFDEAGEALDLFRTNYLEVVQAAGVDPVVYPHVYAVSSNTGVNSGLDFNNDGIAGALPNDGFGFGFFPGQFAFAILSKYEIDTENLRSFQQFLWKDMPDALLPADPEDADGNGDFDNWYTEEELEVFRLSSKSHVDAPIDVAGSTVHFLVSHPTPPVFDGPEDFNGTRNHDEVRFWGDYVTPGAGDYIYDDAGVFGGLPAGESFVIAGDQNADAAGDGDATNDPMDRIFVDAAAAINPAINGASTPSSPGGTEAALQGPPNETHVGDPAHDTADFGEIPFGPGNLRVDYVIPSADLPIAASGVFWPELSDPLSALTGVFPFPSSDHRAVWVDVVVD